MGIDIYAEWTGMTGEERNAQIVGYDPYAGHVGVLREAYHGEPYATRILVAEAFEEGEAVIPASLLRERLSDALEAAEQREKVLYGENDPLEIKRVLNSYRNFVALCERKEAATGKPCCIIANT
jgi:predicted GTPase